MSVVPVSYKKISKLTKSGWIYILEQDYSYWVEGRLFIIPRGFEFSPSIPGIAKVFGFKATDRRLVEASLIHDWEYYVHISDRDLVDGDFYDNAVKEGYPKSKGIVCQLAVSLFGGDSWRNKPEDISVFKAFLYRYVMNRRDALDIFLMYKDSEIFQICGK